MLRYIAPSLLIFSIFALQPTTAASADSIGEWAGTLEGDFRGYDDGAFGDFKRYAEFTFNVNQDGTIAGSGTGWEHYASYDGCILGRAADVTFDITGYVDQGVAVLRFTEVTPDWYQTIDCTGYSDSFTMHPFRAWRSYFEIELQDGASVDSGAGTRRPGSDYPMPSGSDVFMIGGGNAPLGCPALTITPTMPPASDPRKDALPTDTVSYRMQVAWQGTVPTKVYFGIEGGGENVNPSFTFNPANMHTNPISVLMDVSTSQASEGQYLISVDAWVIDPATGQECHSAATADFILNVAEETQVIEFTRRDGAVQTTNEEDAQGFVVETGDDGATSFKFTSDDGSSSTTVDAGNNTKFTFARVASLVEKATQQEDHDFAYELVTREEDHEFAYRLWQAEEEGLLATILGKVEKLGNSIRDFVTASDLGRSAIIESHDTLTCLLAPADPSVADLCSQKVMIYLAEGQLHVVDVSEKSRMIDRVDSRPVVLADNSLIIPTDTELTVSVSQSPDSVVTTVALIEGSAIVVDLVSEDVKLITSGQEYHMDAYIAADNTVSTRNVVESTSAMVRWWDTPNLEADEGFITAVIVTAIVFLLIIIGGIIVGIYLLVKKIRGKRKQEKAGNPPR